MQLPCHYCLALPLTFTAHYYPRPREQASISSPVVHSRNAGIGDKPFGMMKQSIFDFGSRHLQPFDFDHLLETIEHGDAGTPEIFRQMAAKHIPLCPTLAAGEAYQRLTEWHLKRPPL